MILSGIDLAARTIAQIGLEDGPLHLTIGGTVDAITAPFPNGIPALIDHMSFVFEAAGANTGPVTLNIGGTGAYPIVLPGGAALVAGDISAAGYIVVCVFVLSHLHYHAILIRQPSQVAASKLAGAAAIGSSTRYARADHQHGGAIVGVVDGSAALAGDVGEYADAEVLIGAAVALVTGTPANVTSIPVPAGSWEISGFGGLTGDGTGTTSFTSEAFSISLVSATIDVRSQYRNNHAAFVLPAAVSYKAGIFPKHVDTNVPLTAYLVARSDFTVAGAFAFGEISIQRRR